MLGIATSSCRLSVFLVDEPAVARAACHAASAGLSHGSSSESYRSSKSSASQAPKLPPAGTSLVALGSPAIIGLMTFQGRSSPMIAGGGGGEAAAASCRQLPVVALCPAAAIKGGGVPLSPSLPGVKRRVGSARPSTVLSGGRGGVETGDAAPPVAVEAALSPSVYHSCRRISAIVARRDGSAQRMRRSREVSAGEKCSKTRKLSFRKRSLLSRLMPGPTPPTWPRLNGNLPAVSR